MIGKKKKIEMRKVLRKRGGERERQDKSRKKRSRRKERDT